MATQARTVQRDGGQFFRNVLRIDGAACIILGIVGVVESAWLPAIMGAGTMALYIALGLVSVVGGALLMWLSTRTLARRTMQGLLALAVLLALDGLVLLFGGWVPLTTVGFWTVAAITDFTVLLALGYYLGLRRAG